VKRSLLPVFALACVALLCGAGSYVPGVPPIETSLGDRLPLFSVAPFVALLVAIAVFPLLAGAWWESNANKAKLAALIALPSAGLLVLHFGETGLAALTERTMDYVSLMTFLAALFVVCGGIFVDGSLPGTPLVNMALLALGALLANVIGTTGASMVLIRPLIRANQHRRRVAHVPIFLIFIVANCGGLLTPLGDPPLFLGYLAGVPFGWTLRLWPAWALVNGALLAIFLVWDHVALSREPRERSAGWPQPLPPDPTAPARVDTGPRTPDARPVLRVLGLRNVALLLAIVATVFAAGRGLGNGGHRWPFGVPEVLMAGLAIASWWLTSRELREKNGFTFGPIIEVAILFAGIFITMTPALSILNARGARLGLHEPWHFFWGSGLLSSILDNAPTYLAFTAVASGSQGIPVQGQYLGHALAHGARSGFGEILAAISCGCVLMGALTYIGNGPNFMVKAIAQESNVRMPGFLGYMIYSTIILLPLFVLVTVLLFRF
jgi:Na+/H+ antiporter NhaD/arsenite permease-like protein